jgi:hypothetical protein
VEDHQGQFVEDEEAALRREARLVSMKTQLLSLALVVAGLAGGAEVTPLHKLSREELEARLAGDARAVQLQREGLLAVIGFTASQTNLFPRTRPAESRLLRREEKEIVWSTWQRFLDYLVALDSIGRYHASYYRLKGLTREDAFLTGYAAFLAQYRAALEFIERAENHAELDKILNEPVPELGLPAGTYAKVKFRFLNVGRATEFAACAALLPMFSGDRQPALRAAIRADSSRLWELGRGTGEVLTAKNALQIVQDAGQSAWLPVQAGVSEWMGDTKMHRVGRSLVSARQIEQLLPRLEPGDVLLERREWYLSNIGLPGFWPHAALFIGTPEERRGYFTDAETRAWLARQGAGTGDLDALLRSRYPTQYLHSLAPQEGGPRARVLEAISEGVSFTTLEHSAACDSLAVLRPRLSKREKAQALLRAFHFAGRPYDFNFDFATDAELVCTELVYKAYEPAADMRGLSLPLIEMLGRKVTPANEIVKQFDAQWGRPEQQFDLVLFLDGHERKGRAVEASLTEFRQSWRRPKWHVLAQGR